MREIASDAQMKVQPLLGALRGLMRGLGSLAGPKHMVIISSGWPMEQQDAARELASIAADAASSNVTVHSFTAELSAMAASVSRMPTQPALDRELLLTSVEMLPGMTGGRSARLIGDGDAAFKALSGGLTGYYRLGVKPAPEDLDGKSRRISLKVLRPGVSLVGYRRVMAGAKPAAASAATADPAAALHAAVRSNTPLTGLDLRATSYVLHADTGGTDLLRVVVVGEVMRAVTGQASVSAGLFDQDGKPVAGGDQQFDVPATGPGRLLTAFTVKPGAYLLRLAVRDAEGHLGSLGRNIDARWRKAGNVETTDLMLFRVGPERGSDLLPLLDVVSPTDRIVAQVSLTGPATGAKTQVSFDIAREGETASMLRLNGRLTRSSSGTTVAQEMVQASLLPAGRYTATASIQSGGSATFKRTFRVEAPASPATDVAGTSVENAAPATAVVAPPRIAPLSLAKPARFATSTVLDPAFVAPIFDRLAARSDTGSVRDALERVKAGPWPTDGDQGPLASAPVASHFVAGLGRLQQGDLEGAANDFRAALRAAPDFVPAMIYLGACYAAGNKDKEAASAWQTALLRDRDSAALQRLAIDAWLRAERPAAALALIKQARQRWPDDESFVRQHAQAALADGRKQEGLDLVRTISQPDDPLLLLALATLYEAVRDRSPVWDTARDLAAMRELREVYAKINGQSLALVDAWMAEIATSRAP